MSKTATVLLWLLTRGIVLVLLVGPHAWVMGDVDYFAQSLRVLPEAGLADALVEYPLPGIALVALPWLLAEGTGHAGLYPELVVGFALVTDAAFTALLWHVARTPQANRARPGAVVAWLLAVPLLGATTFARFDLAPGVLAGVAVLLLTRHPRWAALAAAVATGVKLWPAFVLPALATPARSRQRVLLVVAATGTALASASVLLAGWGRLFSPLTWQADRGLQIESVLATPVMVAWAFGSTEHAVGYGAYHAYEIEGRVVASLLAATHVFTLLALLAVVALWGRAWRRGASLTVDSVVWTCLAAVSALMVTSRVLSPQYLLWLLPVAAASLAVVRSERASRRLRAWTAVLLVAAAATHLVFPVLYVHLVFLDQWSAWVAGLLAVRNAILVWLAVHAFVEAWWCVGSDPQRGRALERQAPGPGGSEVRVLR